MYRGPPPDLVGFVPIYCFEISVMGCPWAFRGCHVLPVDWAMWHLLISPPIR
jgi:hypothetical protein